MPIISYFAVVGVALLTLLFVADAKLESHGPLAFSTNFEGLPKPWRPELNPPLPPAKPQAVQSASAAPSLDPQWNTEKPAPVVAAAEQKTPPQTTGSGQQTAKVEQPAAKKQKHASRKQQRRNEYAQRYDYPQRNGYDYGQRSGYSNGNSQRYAWRHDGGGWSGGYSNNPWRF